MSEKFLEKDYKMKVNCSSSKNFENYEIFQSINK